MEQLLVERINQLHVLKLYYSNNMDDLAKDLGHALDESADLWLHDSKYKLIKTRKSCSKSKCGTLIGNSISRCNIKSEDSESSLDNGTPQQMDFSTNGSYQHTDSDDIITKVNRHSYSTSWRHCSTNLGESDSLNENLHPSRKPRRKRKFKRMAVDPPTLAGHEFPMISTVAMYFKKSKRLHNIKSQKISKLSVKSPKVTKKTASQLSTEMENICKEFRGTATSTGKRKRRVHEKSVECSGYHCRKFISTNDTSDDNHRLSASCDDLRFINSKSQETSSGLSSSESECGVLTNDESREADDEQSDFFQEAGPSYGIPNFAPWWHDGNLISNESCVYDVEFPNLLCGSFIQLPEASRKMYTVPVNSCTDGREMRSGRRRLKGMINSGELLPNLPLTKEGNSNSSSVENCVAKLLPNEKKKRRGISPLSSSMQA